MVKIIMCLQFATEEFYDDVCLEEGLGLKHGNLISEEEEGEEECGPILGKDEDDEEDNPEEEIPLFEGCDESEDGDIGDIVR